MYRPSSFTFTLQGYNMLSGKLTTFLRDQGWWYDEASQPYADELLDLGLSLDEDFSRFYLHAEDASTFYGRGREIYHVCWCSINACYGLDVQRAAESLKLPDNYLPMDNFAAGSGYFYNKTTGEVLELAAGPQLNAFHRGELQPQWPSFNAFLEWYFELP